MVPKKQPSKKLVIKTNITQTNFNKSKNVSNLDVRRPDEAPVGPVQESGHQSMNSQIDEHGKNMLNLNDVTTESLMNATLNKDLFSDYHLKSPSKSPPQRDNTTPLILKTENAGSPTVDKLNLQKMYSSMEKGSELRPRHDSVEDSERLKVDTKEDEDVPPS